MGWEGMGSELDDEDGNTIMLHILKYLLPASKWLEKNMEAQFCPRGI